MAHDSGQLVGVVNGVECLAEVVWEWSARGDDVLADPDLDGAESGRRS